MPFQPTNLSEFHNDVFENTTLGQLCGTDERFRDRYLVLRMLGRGGFGVTFLARDMMLPGKPFCVIKQLCPRVSELRALDTARHRFKREAKILATLGSHSQIPMLLDYFVLDDEFYLVQEYIKGATLARLVRRQGVQPEAIVRRILREVAKLLHFVHSQGVIHRDIKPQNIILSQDRQIVLIDFGAVKAELAGIADSSIQNGVTTHFVGTVGFAPPEQFSLRPVYSSDLYALGVTCLYLLTGKAPLDFKSNPRTGELFWQDKVQVSRSFHQILTQMLRPTPQERYQTAAEILAAMEAMSPQDNLSNCMNSTPVTPPTASAAPQRISSLARTAEAIRIRNGRRSAHPHPPRNVLQSSG
ncbi:serine/threonine-protein kinase [Spirulina major CS-329]|uniref:serine/threonine-protein kinase n=1 Tax=Spirulina TaxID=1154 RepID=UPI00232FFFB3|nr:MULTISPECIES: serine/threonine-protein kinase [Spirulina]MDB9493857.1 serine/threonine-protein kinase [Spirulina subsalsa CS-330]MDB9505422.1 serine/threonine-protein kinase [Spirulina major CS-329]